MGPSDMCDNDESTSSSVSHMSTTYSTHPRTVHRPFQFFYPTHAVFTPHNSSPRPSGPLHWSSRNSRKNRFAPRQVNVVHHASGGPPTPDSTENGLGGEVGGAAVKQRLRHAQTRLRPHLSWDVSFWVAILFTLGSILWVGPLHPGYGVYSLTARAKVINGFLLYLPLAPSLSPQHTNAAMWIAFIGGTTFEVASYLMVVEALNAGHEQLFGPALWGLLEGRDDKRQKSKALGTKLGLRKREVNFRWL